MIINTLNTDNKTHRGPKIHLSKTPVNTLLSACLLAFRKSIEYKYLAKSTDYLAKSRKHIANISPTQTPTK